MLSPASFIILCAALWLGLFVHGAPAQPPPSPIEFDFEDGSATGWEVVDESGIESGWTVVDGKYRQGNFVGNFGAALRGGYHVGTYSFLRTAADFSSYRFSVSLTPLATSGEDVGVLFNYRDAENYYRFSTSFADGYSRLEKNESGRFSTLAQNTRGYPPGTALRLSIDVADGVIQLAVNGDKLFSAYDTSIGSGTIGLYARDMSEFDDVSVGPIVDEPRIALASPADYTVLAEMDIPVAATVLNAPDGATVRFLLDGDSAPCVLTESSAGFYLGSCTAPDTGRHELTAMLLDGERILDTQTHAAVATGGHVYVAIGDSITWGEGDHFASDAFTRGGWRRALQGYQTNLIDELNRDAVTISTVFNESVRGDTLSRVLEERIEDYLSRHERADYAIVFLGTNDANGTRPPLPIERHCSPFDATASLRPSQRRQRRLPSGLNCTGSALDGTFKGLLKTLVESLNGAGMTPIVVQVPPRFGDGVDSDPYPRPRSQPVNAVTIEEFNRVIRGEDIHPLTGYIVGPNLLDYYLDGGSNRFHLLFDNLHLGGLAHELLAAQIGGVITGDTALPPIIEDICVRYEEGGPCARPLLYKQELIETGDRLFVDREYALAGSLPELWDRARWIKTADRDLRQSNGDYLAFTLPASATVSVAFDMSASVPAWIFDGGFEPTPIVLRLDHEGGAAMRVYSRSLPEGRVTLGGAAADDTGASLNYAVIVSFEN